jgi:hypothetical protein
VYGRERTPPDVTTPDVKCNAPNVLNGECDPHSKFHVLHRNEGGDGIYIVAHCRSKGHPKDSGQFGDIAVIEYNKKTGATCFYQVGPENAVTGPPLSGDVKAPRKGLSAYKWNTPQEVFHQNCVGCHDNGPFIRSPYLAQLGEVWPEARHSHDLNYLPGTLDIDQMSWNAGLMPYSFVDSTFQSWQAYSVTSSKAKLCTSCHRLGVSAVGTAVQASGTAQILDLRRQLKWRIVFIKEVRLLTVHM